MTDNTKTSNLDSCSFCNKHKDLVVKLIVSHSVAICNECVDLCGNLLKDSRSVKKSSTVGKLDPREIKSFLDQHIVGQDDAKIILSVAVVNHYKRIQGSNQQIQKANILMVGPTGTGKTLLAKTVAQYLNVPFVIADATTLTEAGYVGDDVETLISRLYSASNGDVEATQRGIVFLDEIDKIARKSESSSVSRDVSGEGVQQALLKLVEGTRCKIPVPNSRKSHNSDTVEIDTTNILFIAGGAFVGLEDIVKKRLQGTTIGFGANLTQPNKTPMGPDDLVRYGMIPEFIGRFPVCVSLEHLTKQQLIDILTKVKNNFVEQYQWLFDQDGVCLEFDSESIETIADRTLSTKTGARGLHSELERILLPHMFNLSQYRDQKILHVLIGKDQVNIPKTIAQENK